MSVLTKRHRTKRSVNKFNELDNWIGLMEVDPPITFTDKRAMYVRLEQILDRFLVEGRYLETERPEPKLLGI